MMFFTTATTVVQTQPQNYQLVAADLEVFKISDEAQDQDQKINPVRTKIALMNLQNTGIFDQLITLYFLTIDYRAQEHNILARLIPLDELLKAMVAAINKPATYQDADKISVNRKVFFKYYLFALVRYLYQHSDLNDPAIPLQERQVVIRSARYLRWVFLGKDNELRKASLAILRKIVPSIDSRREAERRQRINSQTNENQPEVFCCQNLVKHLGIPTSNLWDIEDWPRFKEWIRRAPFRAAGYLLIIIAVLIWVVFAGLSLSIVYPGLVGLMSSGCFIYHFWLRDQLKYIFFNSIMAVGFGLLFWQTAVSWIWAPALVLLFVGIVLNYRTYLQNRSNIQGTQYDMLLAQFINHYDYLLGTGLIAVLVVALSLISDQVSISAWLLPFLPTITTAASATIGFGILAIAAVIAMVIYGYLSYEHQEHGKFIYSSGYALLSIGLALLAFVASLNPVGLTCVSIGLIMIAIKYLYDYMHRAPFASLSHRFDTEADSPERVLTGQLLQQPKPFAEEEKFWSSFYPTSTDVHYTPLPGHQAQTWVNEMVTAAQGQRVLFAESPKKQKASEGRLRRSKNSVRLLRAHSAASASASQEEKGDYTAKMDELAVAQGQLIENIVYRCLSVDAKTGKYDKNNAKLNKEAENCRIKYRQEYKEEVGQQSQQLQPLGDAFHIKFFGLAQNYAQQNPLVIADKKLSQVAQLCEATRFYKLTQTFLCQLVDPNAGKGLRDKMRGYINDNTTAKNLDLSTKREISVQASPSIAQQLGRSVSMLSLSTNPISSDAMSSTILTSLSHHT